ncbi:hypothetical protein J23TS9_06380 [Paenibacillus sp. J23TS9]|uniref:hypothetical protein n=1 Tax=Paenibacillus sp. J23TS9 TaxID=2807193 RepID=UPI001B2B22DE|nr:hypothetical protein [Paenibacillus sp. J23TS9]GIP25508.1 hypothetical protein J23TS9_06380 [Paenibacillus sp. J23TS9]
MNPNELRRKMVLALETEKRLLAEHKYIEALDARAEYRTYRRQLTGSWGDGELIPAREAKPA